MYLVVEWTTMSAPLARGCWRYGSGEGVVDHQPGVVAGHHPGHGLDVDHGEEGVGRRLDPDHAGGVGPAVADGGGIGQVMGRPGDADLGEHLGDQAERAPVGIVAHDDVVTGLEEAEDGILGGQAAGERDPEGGALQGGQGVLEGGAGRVAGAGVLIAQVLAHLGLGEGGRLEHRHRHRPGDRLRILAGVDGLGGEAPRLGGLLHAVAGRVGGRGDGVCGHEVLRAMAGSRDRKERRSARATTARGRPPSSTSRAGARSSSWTASPTG